MSFSSTASISIGLLAKRTGCKPETVRYYEQIGLLSEAKRTEGGQRRYAETTVQRLMFIRHARDFGFSIEAIRELLEMVDTPLTDCQRVDTIAKHHLREVTLRIQRLEALKEELQRMITQCSGGNIDSCRIIEVLSDHRLCHHQDIHGGASDLVG